MIFRYSDGSKFEGPWVDAPGYGLQTIAFIDPLDGQPNLRHGAKKGVLGDFYVLDKDGFVIGMDYNTMIDHFVRLGLLKVGSMVGRDAWHHIYQLAKTDRDSLKDVG